jgi:hypothetical protein
MGEAGCAFESPYLLSRRHVELLQNVVPAPLTRDKVERCFQEDLAESNQDTPPGRECCHPRKSLGRKFVNTPPLPGFHIAKKLKAGGGVQRAAP